MVQVQRASCVTSLDPFEGKRAGAKAYSTDDRGDIESTRIDSIINNTNADGPKQEGGCNKISLLPMHISLVPRSYLKALLFSID